MVYGPYFSGTSLIQILMAHITHFMVPTIINSGDSKHIVVCYGQNVLDGTVGGTDNSFLYILGSAAAQW